MVFDKPGFLLIRRSLVRAQVEEPKHKTPFAFMHQGFFFGQRKASQQTAWRKHLPCSTVAQVLKVQVVKAAVGHS
jgi:hypothetical protein